MAKILDKKKKVGRPAKGIMSRRRVCLWAIAVRLRAGVQSCRDLEASLGEDGKWEGLWSRYERGLVEPSARRIGRIEAKTPGSARYFSAGFWMLLENRPYGWDHIDAAAQTLPQGQFQGLMRVGSFGRLCSREKIQVLLEAAVEVVNDDLDGIHGLTAILVLLREAELVQDEEQYIQSLKAWARASEVKSRHRVLSCIPTAMFVAVANSLLSISFADPAFNACWRQFIEIYIDYWHHGEKPHPNDFDGLDCVSRFLNFEHRTFEADRRLVMRKR